MDVRILQVGSFNSVRTEFVVDATLPKQQRSEVLSGFVGVVRAAAQLQVVHGRGATFGEGHNVMQFEKSCLVTTAPIRSNKRAATIVALPDATFDGSWHITSARAGGLSKARSLHFREPFAFQILEQ